MLGKYGEAVSHGDAAFFDLYDLTDVFHGSSSMNYPGHQPLEGAVEMCFTLEDASQTGRTCGSN